MDVKCSQLMRCILCYVSLFLISNAKTQARKGLILYNSANVIIALKKHVYANHGMITKIFEKINNLIKKLYDRQLAKKRPHVNRTTIFKFFTTKDFYKKYDVQHKQFWEDLTLLIIKNHLSMHLIESQWLNKFNLNVCPKVVLHFKKKKFKRNFVAIDRKKLNNYMSYLVWQIVICNKF